MKHLKIRKAVFAMLASCLLSSSALADNGIKIKVFSSADNSLKEFSIDEISKIKFSNDGMTFMFNGGVHADEFFLFDNVAKMMFDGVSSGIDSVTKEKNGSVEISYDGHLIKVSGCDNTSVLMMFDVAGRPVMREKFTGQTAISTDNLTSGVYILKVNNKTFKFSK